MAIGTERVSGVLALSMKPVLLRARSFENPSGSWGEPDPLSALNHQICRRIVSGPHPERLSGPHLGFHDDRSGRESQLDFRYDFRLCFDFIDSRKRKLSPFRSFWPRTCDWERSEARGVAGRLDVTEKRELV